MGGVSWGCFSSWPVLSAALSEAAGATGGGAVVLVATGAAADEAGDDWLGDGVVLGCRKDILSLLEIHSFWSDFMVVRFYSAVYHH